MGQYVLDRRYIQVLHTCLTVKYPIFHYFPVFNFRGTVCPRSPNDLGSKLRQDFSGIN